MAGGFDRQIRAKGRTIHFQRGDGLKIPLLAFVSHFRADELVGNIDQNDLRVTCRTTELNSAGVVPERPDQLIIDEQYRTIESCWPLYEGQRRVGYKIQAKG